MGSVPTLAIEEVGRTFPGVRGGPPTRAIEPTSLRIADNDFICLLGPSGCGKSTLLRIVAGLDRPTTGRVLLDGEPVTGPGAAPAERRRIIAHYIERVGLGGFEHHYPRMLSGGMQQRTALARALANDPKVLLLDEPFGALDNQTRALMQELLLGIWEADRKTVLFVTHDIDEAIFIGNRVAVMTARPGRIKSDIAIDLSHPRHYTVKTTPEFSAYKARLTEEIRIESIRAVEMGA